MIHLVTFLSDPSHYIHKAKVLHVAVNIALSLMLAHSYPTPLITNLQQGFPHSNALHNLFGKMLLNSQLNLSKNKFHMVMVEGLMVQLLSTMAYSS